MGLGKHRNFEAICALPEIAERWQEHYERSEIWLDIDGIYADFQPIQLNCLADYVYLIPGNLETVAVLCSMRIKIATTTGYFTEAFELCKAEAARRGYVPDSNVCTPQVHAGHPEPWMVFQDMANTSLYPAEAVVKVDDTRSDFEEGLNAGEWTVSVTRSSNEIGLSQASLDTIPAEEQGRLLAKAHETLTRTGTHYLINTITELLTVVEDIKQRLSRGEHP